MLSVNASHFCPRFFELMHMRFLAECYCQFLLGKLYYMPLDPVGLDGLSSRATSTFYRTGFMKCFDNVVSSSRFDVKNLSGFAVQFSGKYSPNQSICFVSRDKWFTICHFENKENI